MATQTTNMVPSHPNPNTHSSFLIAPPRMSLKILATLAAIPLALLSGCYPHTYDPSGTHTNKTNNSKPELTPLSMDSLHDVFASFEGAEDCNVEYSKDLANEFRGIFKSGRFIGYEPGYEYLASAVCKKYLEWAISGEHQSYVNASTWADFMGVFHPSGDGKENTTTQNNLYLEAFAKFGIKPKTPMREIRERLALSSGTSNNQTQTKPATSGNSGTPTDSSPTTATAHSCIRNKTAKTIVCVSEDTGIQTSYPEATFHNLGLNHRFTD